MIRVRSEVQDCTSDRTLKIMILTLLLPALETIVNRALTLDPIAAQKIGSLQNQVIEIHIEDWNIHFFIIAAKSQLHFEKQYTGKVSTTVRGTLHHLFQLVTRGATTKTITDYPVDITGNIHALETLNTIFKTLNIDWEERLSYFLGDVLAHKLCNAARSVKNTTNRSAENLIVQTKEFVHYEAKWPTHKQVEQFYADIATLRNDVERAEAKLQQLENSLDK